MENVKPQFTPTTPIFTRISWFNDEMRKYAKDALDNNRFNDAINAIYTISRITAALRSQPDARRITPHKYDVSALDWMISAQLVTIPDEGKKKLLKYRIDYYETPAECSSRFREEVLKLIFMAALEKTVMLNISTIGRGHCHIQLKNEWSRF